MSGAPGFRVRVRNRVRIRSSFRVTIRFRIRVGIRVRVRFRIRVGVRVGVGDRVRVRVRGSLIKRSVMLNRQSAVFTWPRSIDQWTMVNL